MKKLYILSTALVLAANLAFAKTNKKSAIVHFSTDYSEGKTEVTWEVSVKYEQAVFVIERSEDGKNYFPVATVETSGKKNYKYEDNNPLPVYSFYRLRVVSKDNVEFTSWESVIYNPDRHFAFPL